MNLKICQEKESEYEVHLYQIVHWLSQRTRLKCLSELRTVGSSFSKRKETPCSEHFGKKWFIYDLAHLAVIFNHMSEIKLSFQVHCGFCFKKNYKVSRISNQLGMLDFEMLEKVLHPQMTVDSFKKRNPWTIGNYWGFFQKLLLSW